MSQRTKRIIFLLLIVGAIFDLAMSAAIFSLRQTRLRGALNGFPDTKLPNRVPILGVNAELTQYQDDQLQQNLDLIEQTGFVWVRQVFDWGIIEPEQGQYDWSLYDPIVQETSARKLKLVAVLWNTPAWAAQSPTAPPDDLKHFSAFASALAKRYGDRIDVYQIWDEPNLAASWGGQRPNAIAYSRMLEAAYQEIHGHDPDALVLTAGFAPTVEAGPDNLNDVLFLRALYDNGAGKYFDGVGGKPYGFDTGPEDRRVDLNLLNFSHFLLLWEEMVKHGDGDKPLWASHFGWNALPQNWQGQPSMWGLTSQEQQAKWIVGAYQRALGEWPWSGALILENWQPYASADDPRWGFALRSQKGELSKAAQAIREKSALYDSALWPGVYSAINPLIKYSGEWEFTDLGADIVENGNSAVDVPVAGNQLGVIARRDNYRAYLYVKINGEPSSILPRDNRGTYAVLTSADYQPHVEIIPLAANLNPTQLNTIHIEAERGWDQSAIAGFVVGSNINTLPYDVLISTGLILAGLCAIFAIRLASSIDWPINLRQIASKLNTLFSQGIHLALGLIAALAVWIGAALTWGGLVPNLARRLGDGPSLLITALTAGVFYFSPWLLLTIIALIALFVLIYARPSIGLALVMFFTPYYLLPRPLFDRMFSMVEVLSLLTLAAWAIHIVAARREKGWPTLAEIYTRMTSLDKAVALFVGISVISILWAELKGVAVTELRQMVLEPVVIYLVLRTMPLTRQERWRIVDLLILTGTIVSLIGFYQLVTHADMITAEGGSVRIRSVFGTPNNMALYLGRLIPICAAVVLIGGTILRRWLYAGAGALMLAASILTVSKGGLLVGIPAGLAVVVILWAGKWGVLAVGAGIALIVGTFAALRNNPRFQDTFNFQEGSSFFRTQVWQSTIRMIQDHPLTGVGLDQFLYQYRSKYILPDAWQQPDLSQPHNFLLNYWVRLGIIGLVAGIWIQVAFWRLAWRVQRSLKQTDPAMRALAVGLMGGMADFIAHGLVDEVHFVIDLAFIFFMTLGLLHQMGVQAEIISREWAINGSQDQ